MGISSAVFKLFNLYATILVIRILLTWFPNINWYNEPFKTLKNISDIYLEPFRRIIPPIGMLDISPIVAFIVLQIIGKLLARILFAFGL